MACDERWFDVWNVTYQDETQYSGEMNISSGSVSGKIFLNGELDGTYHGEDIDCDGLDLSFKYVLGTGHTGRIVLRMLLQPGDDSYKIAIGRYQDDGGGGRGVVTLTPKSLPPFTIRTSGGFLPQNCSE